MNPKHILNPKHTFPIEWSMMEVEIPETFRHVCLDRHCADWKIVRLDSFCWHAGSMGMRPAYILLLTEEPVTVPLLCPNNIGLYTDAYLWPPRLRIGIHWTRRLCCSCECSNTWLFELSFQISFVVCDELCFGFPRWKGRKARLCHFS